MYRYNFTDGEVETLRQRMSDMSEERERLTGEATKLEEEASELHDKAFRINLAITSIQTLLEHINPECE